MSTCPITGAPPRDISLNNISTSQRFIACNSTFRNLAVSAAVIGTLSANDIEVDNLIVNGSIIQHREQNFFSDNSFTIFNHTNPMAKLRFDTSAITSNTERVIFAPNSNGILPAISDNGTNLSLGSTSYLLNNDVQNVNNTLFGVNAGVVLNNYQPFGELAVDNTGIGANVFSQLERGERNTAIGSGAMALDTIPGLYIVNNTALGYNALHQTEQSGSTAIGHTALESSKSGQNNTAVGNRALSASVVTSFNTAVGDRALSGLIAGQSNVAVGNAAMSNGSTGVSNVALGQGALAYFSGNYNVAIGDTAMGNNTVVGATGNVSIGHQSGYSLTNGADNVIIGRNANVGSGFDSNNIILGVNATSSGNRQFVLRSGGGPSVTNTAIRGLATLVGGTVMVASTQIAESLTANTLIFLSTHVVGGTQGFLSFVKTVGSDFVINSSSGTDTSTIAYLMVEP